MSSSDFPSFSFLLTFLLVAHKIYGVPQTINTANYVYFLAYKELFALRTDSPPTTPPQDLDALVTGNLFHYLKVIKLLIFKPPS